MVDMQVPVPVHAPLQPTKVDPGLAVAVKVTTVPLVKFVEQVMPQLIPAGKLVTVPVPMPVLVTVIVYWLGANVAVADLAASIVTLQVPTPAQPPLQPAKVELASGVAVKVTVVP